MRAKDRSPEYFVSILTYYHYILLFLYISVNFSSKYILRAVRISSFLFALASKTDGLLITRVLINGLL